ncbi:hypothetical protein D9M69_567960 [compost metagenome]
MRILQRDIGDEAQAPVVDADQRHAVGRQVAPRAEHGAVAAHHHGQRCVLADFLEGGDRVFGQPGIARRVRIDEHVPACLRQRVGKGSQRCVQAGVLVSADQGDGRKAHGCVRIQKGRAVRPKPARNGLFSRLYGAAYRLAGQKSPQSEKFP